MRRLGNLVVVMLLAGLLTSMPAGAQPPGNDNLADAAPIGAIPSTTGVSTAEATAETGEPQVCTSPVALVDKTVWFGFTSPTPRAFVLDTETSDFDTVLAVYSGPAGATFTDLTRVGCSNDNNGSTASQLTLTTAADTYYYIQVGGFLGAAGNLVLNVNSVTKNDNLAGAVAIPDIPTSTAEADTRDATLEPGEPSTCGSTPIGKTAWFSYTTDTATDLAVDTKKSNFDTVLAVYSSTVTATSFTDLTPVGCNDDHGGTRRSQVAVAAAPGTRYYIQVGGFEGASGSLILSLRFVNQNDALANAIDLVKVPTSTAVTTDLGALETGEPQPCGSIGATAWYKLRITGAITGTADRIRLVADTVGSNFNAALAVYSSTVTATSFADLTAVGCNDDYESLGGQARVNFTALRDRFYYLQAGGSSGAAGELSLNVKVGPLNDDLADVITISPTAGVAFTHTQSTGLATLEAGEPITCAKKGAIIGSTVWFKFRLTGRAQVTIDTNGSNFDTVVAAYDTYYTTPTFSQLKFLGCNDDTLLDTFGSSAGTRSTLLISTVPSQTYYIQVGGFRGKTGSLRLNVARYQ